MKVKRLLGRLFRGRMGSWKTTAFGIGTVMVAVGQSLVAVTDGNPETTVSVETLLPAAAVAGIGLAGRDDKKEDSEWDVY